MPTGFDTRKGGRTTFADEGIAPVQTTSGASADSRGAQSVGGESIGGVQGGAYSQPGYVAAGLGAYMEKFMEPAVKRAQDAMFFKGYTEAQSGRGLAELTDNGSPLTRVFGPSGFAQGAQAFTAQAAINKFQLDALRDQDLPDLAPEDLAKHMATAAQGMMTGDPYADQQIQMGMLEAQGPLIQTIAKVGEARLQSRKLEAFSEQAHSGSSALQALAVAQVGLGEGADTEALRIQGARFLGSMGMPDDMDPANYQKFLASFMKRSMQEGDFYAVELLRSSGIADALTDDQSLAVDNAYDKYSKQAISEALATPAIYEKMTAIDFAVGQLRMGAPNAPSAADIDAMYVDLNEQVRAVTGIDRDAFSAEDRRQGGGEVIDAIVGEFKRVQSQAQAQANREADQADAAAAQAAKDAARTAEDNARISGSIGAWQRGDDGGEFTTEFNTMALTEYSKGELSGITRWYALTGGSSPAVAQRVQANARAGLGDRYTVSSERAYQDWRKMYAVNPAMAATYYGQQLNLAFNNFDRMVIDGQQGKEFAFNKAFSDVGQYALQAIPAAERATANAEITSLVSGRNQVWGLSAFGQFDPLTPVGERALVRAISSDYALLSQHSNRSPKEKMTQATTMVITSGRFEQYGRYGWDNGRGGQTLAASLGLKPKDAQAVIATAIDYALKRVGIHNGDGAEILRIGDTLQIEYLTADGRVRHETITREYMIKLAKDAREYKRTQLRPTPMGDATPSFTPVY